MISIIIPTFNSSRTLKNCLDSLVDQTFKNFEVILIDNYSTDRTKYIIEEYRAKLNINFFELKNNNIIAKSRNLGINKSSSEWIAFLDSDDTWRKDKLEKCLLFFKNKDVIYHDIIIKKFSKKKYKTIGKIKKPLLKNYLISGNNIFTSSLLVRKDLAKKVGGVDESLNMITSEDYNFLLKIFNLTNRVAYIRKPLAVYNIHENNISKKNFDWSISFRSSIKNFLSVLNYEEKKQKKSEIIYLKSKYYIDKRYKNKKILKLLFYCIKNGNYLIKLKSLLNYIMQILK